MEFPSDLKYSEKHEWARDEGEGQVRVGITDFAQSELGDIYFVDLPEIGSGIAAGDVLGDLEASKSHEEIYSPISGTVVAVNEALIQEPELVNTDPYGKGWVAVVKCQDSAELDVLMSAAEYESFIQ